MFYLERGKRPSPYPFKGSQFYHTSFFFLPMLFVFCFSTPHLTLPSLSVSLTSSPSLSHLSPHLSLSHYRSLCLDLSLTSSHLSPPLPISFFPSFSLASSLPSFSPSSLGLSRALFLSQLSLVLLSKQSLMSFSDRSTYVPMYIFPEQYFTVINRITDPPLSMSSR